MKGARPSAWSPRHAEARAEALDHRGPLKPNAPLRWITWSWFGTPRRGEEAELPAAEACGSICRPPADQRLSQSGAAQRIGAGFSSVSNQQQIRTSSHQFHRNLAWGTRDVVRRPLPLNPQSSSSFLFQGFLSCLQWQKAASRGQLTLHASCSKGAEQERLLSW